MGSSPCHTGVAGVSLDRPRGGEVTGAPYVGPGTAGGSQHVGPVTLSPEDPETVDPWSVGSATGTGSSGGKRRARSSLEGRAGCVVGRGQAGCMCSAGIWVRARWSRSSVSTAATRASFSACRRSSVRLQVRRRGSTEAAVLPTIKPGHDARVGPVHVADEGLRHGVVSFVGSSASVSSGARSVRAQPRGARIRAKGRGFGFAS